MSIRWAAALAALLVVAAAGEVQAQRQRFRLFGGAGFATPKDPQVDLGRTAAVGGGLGFRFNDNLSVETNFTFTHSSREFDQSDVPVDQVQGIPAYRIDANRYFLDGSFLLHFGRRQPFHPFVLAGGGLVRRDDKRTDITFTFDENNVIIDRSEELVFNTSTYEPEGHVGAGFDLYFLYNLAARVEFRLWLPRDTEYRTRMFFFGASYYF